MSFFTKPLDKQRSAKAVAPVFDATLGNLIYGGEHWFTGALPFQGRSVEILLAGEGTSLASGALSSARRIASDLPSIVDQALKFLAGYPGFGGFDKVKSIFSIQEVVMTSSFGCFCLVFHCSEDRDPEAIWRVHFEEWIPRSQGRDD